MVTESITQWFGRTVRTHKDKTAITFFRGTEPETQLTYSDLQRDIHCFVNFLSRYDLKKGDRVILLLEKSVISVVAHLAVLKMGLIAVPLNPGFKKDELAYLFRDASAELILVDRDKKELVKQISPMPKILSISTQQPYETLDFFTSFSRSPLKATVQPTDPGLIIYTSGTTGNPKGAVLTHGNLVSDAKNIISTWDISQNDVLCHSLPLFHVHGLCFALHTALLSGSHVLLLDRFTPDAVLQRLISKQPAEKCSLFMAVPAMYTRLLNFIGEEQSIDFSHMRLLTSGSAPLLEKEFARIKKVFGKEPVEREGMSETGMNFSNPLNGEKKPGSIGLPLPNVAVRIVNPDTNKTVPPGTVGEIQLKSPCIIKTYWQKQVETQQAFINGWFKTGDLGKTDKDGYYFLTDRIKHLIISGGENISAKEVETVINDIKGVIESSVVGIPDEIWGEKVVALVQKMENFELTESTIKSMCKEKLHDWKCPKKIVFTNTIPKNTMGKVLKEKVKKLFL